MITLVGVGHVFDISRNIENVIMERVPSVVCVELDPVRYEALTSKGRPRDTPLIYKLLAKFQERIADMYGSDVGSEMIAAINAARQINAKVAFIDMDAAVTMGRLLDSMSRREKIKLFFGALGGFFVGKKRIEKELAHFEENEEHYMEVIAREFPDAKKYLIDDRNEHMAKAIRSISERHQDVVVVIGDGHIEGIRNILGTVDIEIIRLRELRKEVPQKTDEVTISYRYSMEP